MSNRLNIYRRVIQPCDSGGRSTESQLYAIVASDDFEQDYVTFESLTELNEAVAECGNNLLCVLQQRNNSFDSLDPGAVGSENFYGNVPLLFDDEYSDDDFENDPNEDDE